MISESAKKHLWDNVNVHDEQTCWPYEGKTNGGGYGVFYIKGVRYLAHRAAYQDQIGEIPNGLFVCHTCDNPPCCNPKHLWLGSKGDNNRDRHLKGRSVIHSLDGVRPSFESGSHNPKAKLTESDVINIKSDPRNHAELGRAYGVNETTIRDIKKGITWKRAVLEAAGVKYED